MEKEIIMFEHYQRLTFSRFLTKLLATNCCTQQRWSRGHKIRGQGLDFQGQGQ